MMTPMNEHELLAEQFETSRTHLRSVAYRMLGSTSEAEDAVQEAWLRLSRSDTSEVRNLDGWLTTVVARVCLDMLRSRTSRREDPLVDDVDQPVRGPADGGDPEHEAVLADSVGLALLVVLETLAPAERLAFVLHDMFAVPFEEIGPIVGRSPAATRQLASRARRRVQGAKTAADISRQREVVGAFLAASRGGNFDALLTLLDPDVVLRADAVTVAAGAEAEVIGARRVAETFGGRARAAQVALVDGVPGLVWMVGGQPKVVFEFVIEDTKIVGITLLSDPVRLQELTVTLVRNQGS